MASSRPKGTRPRLCAGLHELVVLLHHGPQAGHPVLEGLALEVVLDSLVEQIAQAVLCDPKVHGVQYVDAHHEEAEVGALEEGAGFNASFGLLEKELPGSVAVDPPGCLGPELPVVLVRFVGGTPPANIFSRPRREAEELLEPCPVTTSLDQ
eukprot:6331000-Lingulodinium_polyedra.AAC.2